MSGLVLKLAPNERVLVNGAVIENGGRRSRLNILTPNANILRLRDAIHPHEANTPVRRVCYVLQLILSGDQDLDHASRQAQQGIAQLKQVFTDESSAEILESAHSSLKNGKVYPALKSLRDLLPKEDRLISEANSHVV